MTRRRPLELDFVYRPPAAPWAGRLLLALAVALTLDVALSWREARSAVKDREMRIAALARAAGPARAPGKPGRPASPEELAAAADTVRRISLSWDALFAALEAASNDGIALLAVEPDAKSQTVRITAEGKDYAAALAYVLELRRAGKLERVHLVHHEVKRDDPHRAVAFSVAAAWSEKPR